MTNVRKSTSVSNIPADVPHYIPTEINLSQLPFFASDTTGLKKKVIEYSDVIHLNTGETVEFKWEVSGSTKYGYPGPFAERVHHVIIEIAVEQGFPIQNPIKVNITDVCRRLGLDRYDAKRDRSVVDSRERKRVKDAIRSIRAALIVCERAFRLDGNLITLDDDGVSLYERTAFVGEHKQGEKGEKWKYTAIWLSPFLLQSMNSPYLRPIDRSVIDRLSRQAYSAPKLYKYLSYLFALRCFSKGRKEDFVDVPYHRACKLADIKIQTGFFKAERSFELAHQALMEEQIIASFKWIGTDQGMQQATIRYYPGARAQNEYKAGPRALKKNYQLNLFGSTKQPSGDPTLVHQLLKLGFDQKAAEVLLHKHKHDKIIRHLEILAFEQQRKAIHNPPGWLRASLDKPSFTAPKGFRSTKQLKKEQERKAALAQAKALEEAQEKQKTQAQEAKYKRLDDALASLPKVSQTKIGKQIDKMIREKASAFERQYLREHPDVKDSVLFRAQYYQHLEQLLEGALVT